MGTVAAGPRSRRGQFLAQRIADALVAAALLNRLGDGRGEHLRIEVRTHALDNLPFEQCIRLGLATQLMPFLRRWSRCFVSLVPLLRPRLFSSKRWHWRTTNSPSATAGDDLRHPQPVALRVGLVHPLVEPFEPIVLGKNVEAPNGPLGFRGIMGIPSGRSSTHRGLTSILWFVLHAYGWCMVGHNV